MRTSTPIMLLAAPLALAACDSGQDMESMDEMGTDEMAILQHRAVALQWCTPTLSWWGLCKTFKLRLCR